MARTKRLSFQTYRVETNFAAYVAFQLEDRSWKMGVPVDWDDPVGAGLVAGTVSHHRTLHSCRSAADRRARTCRRTLAECA